MNGNNRLLLMSILIVLKKVYQERKRNVRITAVKDGTLLYIPKTDANKPNYSSYCN